MTMGTAMPSMELLLPLAQVYRVPIDDLVGAPDVADRGSGSSLDA